MKKLAVLILMVLSFFGYTFCQTYDYLDRNQIKAMISSDGTLFNTSENGNQSPCFEVPKGLGINSIYSAKLWIAGLDDIGKLRFSARTYSYLQDYYFGPIADDYSSSAYKNRYNRVWKVNLSEIQYHIENFENPDYEMPESFMNWPAKGDISNGEAENLAPYYDFNNNGNYDPDNGDFPLIRGDQAIYFIYNDGRANESKTGLEIHGMAYCYNPSLGSVLPQTVFVNYRLINRSSHNYHDLYAGMWTDFELGYSDDDLFGSDSINQMMYVYNADNYDGNLDTIPFEGIYGSTPPVQGVVMLNKEVYASVVVDCCFENIDTVVYNYLKGLWFNGQPMVINEIITNYYASGYPENGTGWISYAGYTRALISAGPYSLNKNEEICVDVAFPYARDFAGNNLTSLALLREKAEALVGFYDNTGFTCGYDPSAIQNYLSESVDVYCYPNPSTGIVNIDMSDIGETQKIITVISSDGKLVNKVQTSDTIYNVKFLAKGLYLIVVESSGKRIVKKVNIM
ncbi:MAG TPA: T9SS type A sorting domain-containing protein [Bacteroidales bacterium]|nr:T9SS type A sorting domain-containing protein [Bacteroidales bacterium]